MASRAAPVAQQSSWTRRRAGRPDHEDAEPQSIDSGPYRWLPLQRTKRTAAAARRRSSRRTRRRRHEEESLVRTSLVILFLFFGSFCARLLLGFCNKELAILGAVGACASFTRCTEQRDLGRAARAVTGPHEAAS